ncbi:hypothetical protein QEN19_002693 [Hanseniaspora menglaensis]
MSVALVNFYKEEGSIDQRKIQYEFLSLEDDISINEESFLKYGADWTSDSLTSDSILSLQQITITHKTNLIIKNIDSAIYNKETLAEFLEKFGPINEFKTIEDHSQLGKLICFVNFKHVSGASNCLKRISALPAYSHLFVNYHIERLEREKKYNQEFKEDNSDHLFKKVYVGFSDCKEHLTQSRTSSFNNFSFQRSNKTNVIVNPHKNDNFVETLFNFTGIQIYKKLLALMNKKESVNKFFVQSFHFHQTYCIFKMETHQQALELIKCLNGVSFELNGHDHNLFLHRAFVNRHSVKLCNSRKVSNISKTKSTPFCDHGNFSRYFYPKQHSEKRFFEITQKYNHSEPLKYPFFSSTSGSPTFSNYPLATRPPSNESISVPSDTNSHLLPHFYYYHPSSQFPNSVSTHGFPYFGNEPMYPCLFPMNSLFPMVAPYQNNINNYENNKQGFATNYIVPNGAPPAEAVWPYPIPLSTQQHSNLYIQNLPLSWTDEDLADFIINYLTESEHIEEPKKELISYKVITDNFNENSAKGLSKGYAFVSFINPLLASKCMNDLNGYQLPAKEYIKKINNSDNGSVESEVNESVTEKSYRIKINFAMKRGKLLSLAKHIPACYNKYFLESMDEQLSIGA